MVSGQSVLFALLIVFIILPVAQAHTWHRLGKHTIGWTDVRWLVGYLIAGFFVLRFLRGILL